MLLYVQIYVLENGTMINPYGKMDAETLRKKAEELLKKKNVKAHLKLSEDEMLNRINELELQKAELELQNDELKFVQSSAQNALELYYFSPSGYFSLSPKGQIIELNRCGAQMLGLENSDLENNQFVFFVSDNTKTIFTLFLESIFEFQQKQSCEVTLSVNDKLPLYVHLDGIVFKEKELCLVTAIDISNRILIEEGLKYEKYLLQSLMNNVPANIYFKDLEGRFMRINNSQARLFGLSEPEQAIGKSDSDFFSETHAALAYEDEQEIIRTGEVLTKEEKVSWPDGGYKWFSTIKLPFRDIEKKIIGTFGFSIDVTEKKLSEEALRESEIRFRSYIENAPIGVIICDEKGRYIQVNPATSEITGYSSEELLELSILDVLPNESREYAYQLFSIMLEKGRITGEFPFVNKAGQSGVWLLEAVQLSSNRFMALVIDITERKKAEEALRLSELRNHELYTLLRLLSDTMPDLIWAKDLNKKFIFANKAICEKLLNASDTSEPIGKTDLFFALRERETHPEDAAWHTFGELCMDSDAITLKEMKEMQFYEFGNVKGKFLYLDVHKAPLFNNKGELIGVVGSGRDITEHMLTEKEIEDQKLFLQQLLETISNPIFYKNREGIYLGCNSAFAEFIGLPKEQIIGKTVHELYQKHLADIYHEKDSVLLVNIGHQIYETQFRHADGSLRDVIFTKETLIDVKGNIEGLVGVIVDITEHKQIEEKVKSLLAEKEVILKEVHHRIKNNMNTIKSLLSLQTATTKEPAALEALNDAESRIHSMMVLYDKLYRSSDFREISLKEYLTSLVGDIVNLFTHEIKIKLETNIEDYFLPVQKVLTIGIIINELITNIMKYAFVGRPDGIILLSAAKVNENIIISLQDNGIGLPEHVDFVSSSGFGMQLVGMLTEQIEGNINIERDKGTKFILEFPINENNN